jgi:uncharacterized protein (TIGR02266 family)
LLVHESVASLELGVSDKKNMADARKDKRTLLSLKIRYKSATLEDFIERYSSDISRGGVFIKAKKPLAVGTLLKFEFILQDQSTLIHGVGRVVWRREGAESDPANPSGMGIKFIKMDPASRSVVQRIAEDRGRPGVFDQGKDGIPHAPELASDPSSLAEADRTKVRHVSEFLASALEEGGAGDVAKREAQAGVERARQISDQIGNNRAVAARGAFSAHREAPVDTASVADSPARGAMSAFGGSGLSTSGRISSAAAPAMDELDAEDDFLDDETTKIHDLPESDFPADADATVIAKEAASPFIAEQRLTPVVPASAAMPELRGAVPDLFGPGVGDSFGPAPGEFIDASLLDPAVQTVPPPAGGTPSVPEAPGIPAEAFQLPQASTPAWTTRPTPQKTRPSAWIFAVGFALLLGAAGGAAWQLGYADDVMKLAAPYLGQSAEPIAQPSPDVVPLVVPTPAPEEASAEAQPEDTIAEAAEPDDSEVEPEVVAAAEPEAAAAAETGTVKFQVVSRPSGAFVSVDGKGVGRTPLELEYEVGQTISFFSKARGYLARRHKIRVGAEQARVNLWLAPLPYVVQVVTSPVGARASAVGGGETNTPGSLQFKTMPASRSIVISKDGYKTTSQSVSRTDFTEETRRMAATLNVTLQKDGSAAAAPPSTEVEDQPEPPAAEPTPTEAKAEPEPPIDPPEAVEAAPEEAAAPSETSETTDADAP